MRIKDSAYGRRHVMNKGGGAPRKGGNVVPHKVLAASSSRARKGAPRKRAVAGVVKKKRGPLDEIREQQKSTAILLAFMPFVRCVRAIAKHLRSDEDFRF